ncbi:CRISPR-associated endonuclease Cas2 [Candidatus Chlorohelix sp.]|uniref:CRISPR-associated endonuclease Cas2 n=1 Tax=Candidatus Chlorohelix sp. TaxID=3139201 RepID=UPI00305E1419
MITLFLYDITSDRIRGKIAQICQDYGLKRIQYSAFLGDITANKQEELWLKCRRRLAEEEGNLMLFVLNQQDLARSRKYISKGAETKPVLLVEPTNPPLLSENNI